MNNNKGADVNGKTAIKVQTRATCSECERVFDLLDEDDAGEWFYGHDCEDV